MGDAVVSTGAALGIAAEVVDQWGGTSDEFTGRWLDPRSALIEVGIINDGEDEAIREFLQTRVPASIRVRVRFVSAAWVRLHQLQVRVADHLNDKDLWGRYAVSLKVDQNEQHVEIGLLPSTPESVAAQILKQFPTKVVLKRNASRVVAVLG